MDGGGAGAARADGDWLHVYGRVVAMLLPRVDALASGRARLEAVNALQHEFWEARDALLQHRLLQAEESRRRWEAAYIDLQPSGDYPKFTELQVSDLEDLTTFVDVLAAENTEFQIKAGEVDAGAENSQNAAGHGITRDLEAELRNLKQAYEALCSEKDKEVCALKQNIEQLQVASRKKDGEIHRLRTRAKAAEAKRRLVQGKLQNMCSLTKEIGGVIEMCKDRQRETSQTHKKDMSEMQKKGCSEGPAVRVETKNDSSKQMLAEGGQPEAIQKRKCLAFLLDDAEQNGNDCQTSNQIVEPPKKKRVSGRNEVEKENNKKLASSKVHSESNRQNVLPAKTHRRAATDNTKSREAPKTAGGPWSLGQRPAKLRHAPSTNILKPITSSSAPSSAFVETCDLSGLLAFDPAFIDPTPFAVTDKPATKAIPPQFQRLRALLSSSIEERIEGSEEVKGVLAGLKDQLPVALQAKLWPVVGLSSYGSRVKLARERINLRRAQLPLKTDIADRCRQLNEKKVCLDVKTDTSVSVTELAGLKKELEDLEEKVRVTKQLICDKEASIARSQDEAEVLKAQMKTELSEIRVLHKQLVTGKDEDDEAEIAEVDRVRADALHAFEAFLQ